ncbi:MAG TPA: hypothetical protein DEU95_10450 [Chloroflexi bacterium]|jgi:hypothetical protein|nr:hypothetical protein [Chloroflexota bacterium]HCG30137.1 hypothetical protein [Chloroflexota bacterium]
MRWLSDGERETIEQLRAEAAHDAGQDDETATCMHCGAEIEDDDPICRECETLDPEARNCEPIIKKTRSETHPKPLDILYMYLYTLSRG